MRIINNQVTMTKEIPRSKVQMRFGRWCLVIGYFLVFGFWLLVIAPSGALACSCAPLSPQEYFDNADAVFTGEVLDVDQGWGDLEIKIKVLEISKMEDEEKIVIIHTALTGAECGYTFQTGRTYVVYAIAQDGRLYTDLCSGTHKFLGR